MNGGNVRGLPRTLIRGQRRPARTPIRGTKGARPVKTTPPSFQFGSPDPDFSGMTILVRCHLFNLPN